MTNTPSTPDPSNEHSDDHEIGAASDSEDSSADAAETFADDSQDADTGTATDENRPLGTSNEDITADLGQAHDEDEAHDEDDNDANRADDYLVGGYEAADATSGDGGLDHADPTDVYPTTDGAEMSADDLADEYEPADKAVDEPNLVADNPTDVYQAANADNTDDAPSAESVLENFTDLSNDEPDAAPFDETDEEPIADDADQTENLGGPNGHTSQRPTTGFEAAGFPGTVGPSYVQPLMRDRYGMLGGIASGVGKRYGLDISLVRIAFVLAGLTGFGILAYLAAWVIIPKSPTPLPIMPVDADQTRKALGAALIGGALLFGLSTVDALGSILVPLGLLGAGIWLLTQRPHTPAAAVGQMPPVQTTQPGGQAHTERYAQAARQAQTAQPGRPAQQAPANAYGARPIQPVQAQAPRRTKRRWLAFLLGFVVAGALIFITLASIAVAIFASGDAYIEANEDWGSVEFDRVEIGDNGETRVVLPEALEDLPADAFSTRSLTLDLTEIDAEALSASEPLVDSEFTVLDGTLEVIIPDGLDVDIDASVEDGTIEVVGSEDETKIFGEDISHEIEVTNPDINLTLDTLEGDILISYE